jgi:hypothetical protein
MDSATLVLTALIAIVIVLQIALMVMVSNLKKSKKEEALSERPASGEQRDFRRQREQDNRFQRRPPNDNRPKPAQAPAQQNGDQVERSLRDINLRLKNAEKDQEKERQRIKDTIQAPPQQQQRRPEGQRPRGERDDHFRRGGDRDRGRHGYDRNRGSGGSHGGRDDRSRGNYDSREGRPGQGGQNPVPTAPVMPPASEAPEAVLPVVEKPVEQGFETVTPPESGENLQHGRRFAVKRRVLGAEEDQSESSESAASQNEAPTEAAQGFSEAQQPQSKEQKPEPGNEKAPDKDEGDGESYSSGPISFGR